MPARTPLDADAIPAATEGVLRRHGPAKATVVDLARTLGADHATVCKHFASKQALRGAVTRRWVDHNRDILAVVAADGAVPPVRRLRRRLHAVLGVRQAKIREAPGLFAAYGFFAAAHRSVATDHVADLLHQLTVVITDGAADGVCVAGHGSPARAERGGIVPASRVPRPASELRNLPMRADSLEADSAQRRTRPRIGSAHAPFHG